MAPNQVFCDACNIHINNDQNGYDSHRGSDSHFFNFMIWQWCHYKRALLQDRNNIEIVARPVLNSLEFFFHFNRAKGKSLLTIRPGKLRDLEYVEVAFLVRNCGHENIGLLDSNFMFSMDHFSLVDSHLRRFPHSLPPGASYEILIRFQMREIVNSTFKIPVYFWFMTSKTKETFFISKSLVVSVIDPVENEEVASASEAIQWDNVVEIVPSTQSRKNRDQFPLPARYLTLFKFALKRFNNMTNEDSEILDKLLVEMQPGRPTPQNYRNYFHNCLWLEEMAQALGLERYNMDRVTMSVLSKRTVELEVLGLAEKRPSIIVGDFIRVRFTGDHVGYQGVVQRVNDKSVEISFLSDVVLQMLQHQPNELMDVRFVLGRLPLERMHQGVNQVNHMTHILFPNADRLHMNFPHTIQLDVQDIKNPSIRSNNEQMTAVRKILNGCSQTAPYIVYGPPGTGKTITIVEAVIQIMHKTQKRVLICAPANAACDMLTMKLMKFCRKNELIRVCSESVDTKMINQDMLPYTNLNDEGIFEKISPAKLNSYRVVVTTLILSGRYSGRYAADVVVIDEAAQATEPELTVAIAMAKTGGQIVLAGDPNQLGPICLSKRAGEFYRLERSMLERLMDSPLYESNNDNFITMLQNNYRSHPMILMLSNKLFYLGKLKALSKAAEHDPIGLMSIYSRLEAWGARKNKPVEKKPLKGKPVEFCAVQSKEKRDGRSPSYYNVEEMNMVMRYIKALLAIDLPDHHKVKPTEIGVITPYIRQVYKIKNRLQNEHIEGVEVGSTETFQGREKRIIIISTVRAQNDLLLHDKRYNLGFVRNEKRFNVAMTRAISKLIVIGSATVLSTDSKWLDYIRLCQSEKTYYGAAFVPRDKKFKEDFVAKMRNMKLNEQ